MIVPDDDEFYQQMEFEKELRTKLVKGEQEEQYFWHENQNYSLKIDLLSSDEEEDQELQVDEDSLPNNIFDNESSSTAQLRCDCKEESQVKLESLEQFRNIEDSQYLDNEQDDGMKDYCQNIWLKLSISNKSFVLHDGFTQFSFKQDKQDYLKLIFKQYPDQNLQY